MLQKHLKRITKSITRQPGKRHFQQIYRHGRQIEIKSINYPLNPLYCNMDCMKTFSPENTKCWVKEHKGSLALLFLFVSPNEIIRIETYIMNERQSLCVYVALFMLFVGIFQQPATLLVRALALQDFLKEFCRFLFCFVFANEEKVFFLFI